MGNPILQKLTQGMANQNNVFVNMARMIRGADNPQIVFEKFAKQNPMINDVMNFVKQCGNNPKDAYYKLARQKGVDPDEFLKQFK